jgi:hypothetical protein
LIGGPNSPHPWLLQNASLLCLKIHKTTTERLTTERRKQGFGNLQNYLLPETFSRTYSERGFRARKKYIGVKISFL